MIGTCVRLILTPRDAKRVDKALHQRAQLHENTQIVPKLVCLRRGQREDGSRHERPHRALRRAHEPVNTTRTPRLPPHRVDPGGYQNAPDGFSSDSSACSIGSARLARRPAWPGPALTSCAGGQQPLSENMGGWGGL